MPGFLLLLSLALVGNAEPEVKAGPFHCVTCAAQEISCISTAINQCKEQNACDTVMNASSCVACLTAANCGSDAACSDCPTNQLESILGVKSLVASTSKEVAQELEASPTNLLKTARCRESPSLMRTCGTKCHSSRDQATCAANCLRGVGVQSSCANCFGRKIQCTVKNCLNFCASDANSPGCSSCVSRSCGSCNSEKSEGLPEEESYITALVALSQSQEQPTVLP